MLDKCLQAAATAALILAATALAGSAADAATIKAHKRHVASHVASHVATAGTHELVNDGPGTAYGFHRDPAPFRVGAWRHRNRGGNIVQETADIDAATSGGYYGFPGDSVYGTDRAAYGVYNGADGYGSPYFAGFYGPGGGTDYGPFGHAYDD